MRLNQNTFASLSNYEFLSLRSFIHSFGAHPWQSQQSRLPHPHPLHLFPPPPPFFRGRKSERKNLIMISFRSNEALVLWGPARLPSSWVSGIGWGGGRAVRGADLQGVVCVACVANRLLLLLLCCPAIGAAKNQQLHFVSLPLCCSPSSSCSCCSPAAVPSLSQLVPCALCPVILALATAPRALPWTTDKAINLF